MSAGKERLRRWRERNRAEGKQSFTIMLSNKAKEVLCDEKKASGTSYAAIIENALLNFRKPTGNLIAHNNKQETAKILIDEDSILLDDIKVEENRVKKTAMEDDYNLREGFLPRLLRESRGRLYRIKK
ncbi:MAG: hypothetical protein JXB09_05700 [Deltaproteobacteria bacterium]|nr:hypothetical protein [Deltaproteobacteria bacterium]